MITLAADHAPTRHHEMLPKKPTVSTPRKRKAKGTLSAASASSTGSGSDQSSEEMAVAQEQDENSLATPGHSDPSATEDEGDDDDEPTKDSIPQAHDLSKSASQAQKLNPSNKPAASPPPRRELPFTRPQASRQAPSASTASTKVDQVNGSNNDDDETSDDEL